MHSSTLLTMALAAAATTSAYELNIFSAVECGGLEKSFTLPNYQCNSLQGQTPNPNGVPSVTFANDVPCTLFVYATDDCTGTQATATQQDACFEPGFDILSSKCVILT